MENKFELDEQELLKGICDDCIHYKSNNKKCEKCKYNSHRNLLNELRKAK